jgi:hypothetical protein
MSRPRPFAYAAARCWRLWRAHGHVLPPTLLIRLWRHIRREMTP